MFDERVRERDLDHFLLEELHASEGFRVWFLERSGFKPPLHVSFRVERSPARVTDARQTDLRLGYFDGEGRLVGALLIENKVTDGFQDGQAESYAAEVVELRRTLGDANAAAVLVAPSSNALVVGDPNFAASILIEELAESLSGRLAAVADAETRARLEVKVELLEALAGKRSGSRWNPSPIPEKRDFWAAYVALLAEACPTLRLRPSSHGKKATTLFFDGFPHQGAFPVTVNLKHELGKVEAWKYANLQFGGAGRLLPAFAVRTDLFPSGGPIFPAQGGESLMVRIRTPGITPSGESFEAERDKVLAGMSALNALCGWLAEHHAKVSELLFDHAS